MEYAKNLSSYIRENYTEGTETYHLRDIMHDYSYTEFYANPHLSTKQVADLLVLDFSVGCKPKQIKNVRYSVYVKNLKKVNV